MNEVWNINPSHALNLALNGAQQFPSENGHFSEGNVSLYWKLAEGTAAKVQGTTVTAVDAEGYLEACPRLSSKST